MIGINKSTNSPTSAKTNADLPKPKEAEARRRRTLK